MISSASISFKPRPNRWRSIAAVRTGSDISAHAAEPRGRPWQTAQLSDKTGADGDVGIDVADTVFFVGALSLRARELSLEELASAADGAERDRD